MKQVIVKEHAQDDLARDGVQAQATLTLAIHTLNCSATEEGKLCLCIKYTNPTANQF